MRPLAETPVRILMSSYQKVVVPVDNNGAATNDPQWGSSGALITGEPLSEYVAGEPATFPTLSLPTPPPLFDSLGSVERA